MAAKRLFQLACAEGFARLRENYGFRRAELGGIAAVLAAHTEELCRRWEEIHGLV